MFAREMNGIVAIEARGAKILRVRNDLLQSFKAQIRKRIGGNIFFDLVYEMGGGDQLPPCRSVNAIKAGNMTLTFRLWDSCRLIQGNSYVVENLGRILIKEAKKVSVSSITDADAKRAGYDNAGKILSHFRQKNPDLDPQKDCCWRIEFQYVAQKDRREPGKPVRAMSPHILDKYSERLKRLDRRAQGITFSAILKEMSKSPFNKITNLMDHFQCEFTEMRRKLHRLSEEQLVEIDQRKRLQLTSRGRQLIEYLESKLQAQPKS